MTVASATRRTASPYAAMPHARLVLLARLPGLPEGPRDDVVQPRVDLLFLPEVLLQALHPLEVGDDDAARVREHVREDEDALVLEDLVGGRGDRPVRALADDPRLHLRRVVRADHLLERAGREHVALQQQQLLVRDRVAAAEARQRPVLGLVREHARHVEPFRSMQPTARVRDGDHERALLGEHPREMTADVAEALHGDAEPVEALALPPAARR